MNKIYKILFVSVITFTVIGYGTASATTVSMVPNKTVTTANSYLNVTFKIIPNTANYAEKISLSFPADMLEVTSFNFSPSWIALNQPGYDAIDNNSGTLVKTGGYPSGFTTMTDFGTVTFRTKKAGTAAISVKNDSQAFDINGPSALTGAAVIVNITTASTKPAGVSAITPTPTQKSDIEAVMSASTTPTFDNITLIAAPAEATDGNTYAILWVVIILLILFTSAFMFLYKQKTRK